MRRRSRPFTRLGRRDVQRVPEQCGMQLAIARGRWSAVGSERHLTRCNSRHGEQRAKVTQMDRSFHGIPDRSGARARVGGWLGLRNASSCTHRGRGR